MSNWSATKLEILEVWSKRHEQGQTNFSERRQATVLALTSVERCKQDGLDRDQEQR